MTENLQTKNSLGSDPVGALLWRFALPSIISMLVSSLYNIVDQFFIGRRVGELGNAATNIAFPLSTCCLAVALLFGIGGASAFNLSMGRKQEEEARQYMGSSFTSAILAGLVIMVLSQIFLEPLLYLFGSSDLILPYARDYTRIVALGYPLMVLITSGGHLIRADGRPSISMVVNLSGAILNIFLDALFVFVLDFGMKGAAAATLIGQVLSAGICIYYMSHTKTAHLERRHLVPKKEAVLFPISLGAAACFNQLAIMVVQIVINNSLRVYGSQSVYGSETPIAVLGIVMKVHFVFMSFIIGISQGLQPITSYNYGAKQYDRVRKAYRIASAAGFCIAGFFWLLFMLFPKQLIGFFGKGNSELYEQFAVLCFHVFLCMTFLNFLQPITSNFFSSIGKAKTGMFLSLTRQIIFLLPLVLILPRFFGIEGLLYAGPVADLMAALASVILAAREFDRMKKAGKLEAAS